MRPPGRPRGAVRARTRGQGGVRSRPGTVKGQREGSLCALCGSLARQRGGTVRRACDSVGVAVAIGVLRRQPQGYVAADERRGGGSAARRHGQGSGMAVAIGALRELPQGYIAADKQQEGETTGRRRRLSPARPAAGVCCLGGAAGKRSGGMSPRLQDPQEQARGMSPRRSDEKGGGAGNRRPARMAGGVCRLGQGTGRRTEACCRGHRTAAEISTRSWPPDREDRPTEETDGGSRRAGGQEKDDERVGEWADGGGVEEMTGRQDGVAGLTEELGRWGSLGESGGLACRVAAAMEC